ncbi:pilus assembly protein TadG-related protein [Pseudomonas laurylsulfatiphila]|uniref:pilus assembly protein TadG-related protein n=1 Tax=Pseudomonas laurylsulfatiphila TaxID=2011015 RepID=UPI003D1E956F|nr:putative membrane protein [Pseudomonas reinekei]
MSPRMQFRGPARQRGAIGLMAALTLTMALGFMLLVVDTGRLYLEQRKLQRIADVAALEAVTRNGDCLVPAATAATYAQASATRNGYDAADSMTLNTTCGTLQTGANNLRTFGVDASKKDAVRVIVTHTVPTSVAAGIYALMGPGPVSLTTQLTATAVSAPAVLPPLAMLTIGSTALVVDSSQSAALNLLLGQMLGGSLNLSAAGWQGLVDTQISLLGYLNQLAIDAHVTAGDYTTLLSKNIALTQLLDSAITVLQAGGTSTSGAVSGLTGLKVAAGSTSIVLGQLLQLQTGAASSALNTNLQVFQLVEAFIQLANSQNVAVAKIPLNIPGLVNGEVKVKVIQPPQLSAIGNPALVTGQLNDPNRIYVRTAQVRTVLSLNLPVLSGISGLANAITSNALVSGLTDSLNNLLHLNLAGTLSSLLCTLTGSCDKTDLKILPTPTIDISLEVAAADSHVTAYTCVSDASKTLTTQTNTSLVKLKVGKIDTANAFSSSADVSVQPLALIDIGKVSCVFGFCDQSTRVPFYGGGLGVKIDTSVASTQSNHVYNQPPEIKQPPLLYSLGTQGIVNSLKSTLGGIQVEAYKPTGSSLLGDLLVVAAGTLNGVQSTLGAAIQALLSPLVDPILDGLLANLGISLNTVDVGANLSCKPPGRPSLVI